MSLLFFLFLFFSYRDWKAEILELVVADGDGWRRLATMIEDGPLITIGQEPLKYSQNASQQRAKCAIVLNNISKAKQIVGHL